LNSRPATNEEGNIKVNRGAMTGIFLLRPSRTVTGRQINAIGGCGEMEHEKPSQAPSAAEPTLSNERPVIVTKIIQ
jgi:hypothetical protein